MWRSRKRRGNTPIWISTTTRDPSPCEDPEHHTPPPGRVGAFHLPAAPGRVFLRLAACLFAWFLCLSPAASGWWDEETEHCYHSPPMSTWYRIILDELASRYPDFRHDPVVIVRVGEQRLYLFERGIPMQHYPVSTSRFGVGNVDGSLQTPLGVHQVRRRIGDQVPPGTIFRGRRNTGEQAHILTDPEERSVDDNITSRILWLDGLEPGVNRGEGVDSFQRFIYIHGTDEEGRIGQPASDGCVRMKNADVIDLFDRVPENTLVMIVE